MDHSGMDHGDMDHGHGDMDMGDQCNMNMLFTWSTKNLCIVFRQWRITGPLSLLLSIVAIILLSAGYEAVRDLTRRYEASSAAKLKDDIPSATTIPYLYIVFIFEDPLLHTLHEGKHKVRHDEAVNNPIYNSASPPYDHTTDEETSSLLGLARNARQTAEDRRSKMVLAALYAVQVFYSFFIMLLFMTYNGWIMISVAVGAFVGYMAFGQSSATKSVSCH